MKKITILLFCVLVSLSITAQNKATKVADKLFERFEYVQAVEKYLALAPKESTDNYVFKQLGNCYF